MMTLNSKLKQYGTLTAGVLIAGTKVTKSQIFYKDINPDAVITAFGTINLDLDNDAVVDLRLDQDLYAFYYFYNYVRARNHPSADLVQYTASSRADRLDISQPIGTSQIFSTSATITLGYNSSSSYDWSNGAPHVNKYLGVRLTKGVNYLYGWIRLDYNSGSTGFTVKDMGVQMTPNTQILAGNGMNINDDTLSIAEDAVTSAVVGIVTATGPAKTFSITAGNTGNAFSISPTTGEILVNGALDFETTPTYALTVDVTDGTFTDQATITIDVTDVNESPIISSQTFSIDENSTIGTIVGTVLATDPENAISSFTITAGNIGNSFAIDTSGVLTVNDDVDFEINPGVSLTVEVGDGTNTSSANIIVNINDVVEIGIQENTGLDFKIYPNPIAVDGKISIELPFDDAVTVSVMSIDGQTISLLQGVRRKTVLTLNDITSGVYMVKIQKADGQFGLKRVVIE